MSGRKPMLSSKEIIELKVEINRYTKLSETALGWFLKSTQYPYKSDEWMVCRLKERLVRTEAYRHLDIAYEYAIKELELCSEILKLIAQLNKEKKTLLARENYA